MLMTCATAAVVPPPAPRFPGSPSAWHGFERWDFPLEGRACIVVAPKSAAPGRPWIWRARFFGHEPQADIALLGRGFHLAYIDVANLYGNAEAVAVWDRFHAFLTGEHGLSDRVVLEGFSRGGLIIYNWASRNPDKVACIYGDAPVCDIRSWPGGKGVGNGSAEDWKRCLKAYGLTEEAAATFEGSPIDGLAPLARRGVQILHVCGDADQSVPLQENTRVLETRYRALGGDIRVIVKKGCAHHPHSLPDPTPIVEFVIRNTASDDD